jgi:hypothetical protein
MAARLTVVKAARHAGGYCDIMLDFAIDPPLIVKDTPRPRHLKTLAEAHAFVDEMLHQRRLYKLREIFRRIEAVSSEDEAIEAVGALRELLALDHLLELKPIGFVPSKHQ